MTENQVYIFVSFTFVGVVIGILFDAFRILRKILKTNDIITYIEDILFWLMTGIIIIYSMYKICDGQLRFFTIIGIIIGTTMYMLTISKYIIKISIYIINFLKKILIYPIMITKKLIFRPIIFICINIRRKIIKNDKKNRGFLIKKEKYNNI